MLRSIERIRKLGVYQACAKPAGAKEFASKNLIYGWNYSGKTTLCRIFAKTEAKSPHPRLQRPRIHFQWRRRCHHRKELS